jgi:hypothetical protein
MGSPQFVELVSGYGEMVNNIAKLLQSLANALRADESPEEVADALEGTAEDLRRVATSSWNHAFESLVEGVDEPGA